MKRPFRIRWRTKAMEVWDPKNPVHTFNGEAENINEALKMFMTFSDPLPENINTLDYWMEPIKKTESEKI